MENKCIKMIFWTKQKKKMSELVESLDEYNALDLKTIANKSSPL